MKPRDSFCRLTVLAIAFLILFAAAPPAAAQSIWGDPLRVALPFNLVDRLDGPTFKIAVPANWNGTLLIHLVGLKTGPEPPEPALAPPVLPGSGPSLDPTLLSMGYALAASQVATLEWQQKAEVQDSFALATYFRATVGQPRRVILLGWSLGGLAALRLIEEYPRSFDAAIATCAPAAGTPKRFDRSLDFSLAYSVVFGWPDAWGTVADVRSGINFAKDVSPVVPWPKADGSNRGGWEFIRLISGISSDAFWRTDPMWGYTGFLANMVWATQQREAMESWARGPVAQNRDHIYSLKPEDKAYLAGLGVNADDLLWKMNYRAPIDACAGCRDFAYRFGSVRGALTKPVITLHTTADGTADISHESAYRAAVEAYGSANLLVQAYVTGVGHCAFTPTQLLTALAAMEKWLDTGIRPDASAFPAQQGFDNGFAPPPWPY
ncbi:MAG: prolyl oligopeptidase family serine peptidase [Acidobacteriia bacterium]|nr:prolyl oligopeptidase family serine peptidase [Terriglobia bacterium]